MKRELEVHVRYPQEKPFIQKQYVQITKDNDIYFWSFNQFIESRHNLNPFKKRAIMIDDLDEILIGRTPIIGITSTKNNH